MSKIIYIACVISSFVAILTKNLIPTLETTAGPFWVDEELYRIDVTTASNKSRVLGLPFKLHLIIKKYNSSTKKADIFPGAIVDIWYANHEGKYSDEEVEKTKGETFLRGQQISDKDGCVNFRGVYPGYYTGRSAHIHIRIREYKKNKLVYNDTTQIFFDEKINNDVYTKYGNQYGHGEYTTNSRDSIFDPSLIMKCTGNVKTGFTGEYTLVFPFKTGN